MDFGYTRYGTGSSFSGDGRCGVWEMVEMREIAWQTAKKHFATFLIALTYVITTVTIILPLGFTTIYTQIFPESGLFPTMISTFLIFVSFLALVIGNLFMKKWLYIPAIICSAILFIVTLATVLASLALSVLFFFQYSNTSSNGIQDLLDNYIAVVAYIFFQILCALVAHLYYKQLMLLISDYHYIQRFVELYESHGKEHIAEMFAAGKLYDTLYPEKVICDRTNVYVIEEMGVVV
ncbi:unnamed protein product [Bursaphelenchus xylophilus]|uniref:(pine wood nematode) hypothetical protein n=1 Tax=Bursaphelenchus xylophilus TaxID=6326 RepID=A0A1I7S1F1_BURXY|nr:unnamed protein product [Bursaphelenchus xylophilus]CAG9081601.1 unnamed protein product [Bursaphelenchus xylophilus]